MQLDAGGLCALACVVEVQLAACYVLCTIRACKHAQAQARAHASSCECEHACAAGSFVCVFVVVERERGHERPGQFTLMVRIWVLR